MSALSGHVEDYLALRRALGFKLEREGQWLTQLAAYVDAAGAATLTSDLAVAWARQRTGAGPNGWAKRLGVVRKFAAFLHTIDPDAEIPARRVPRPSAPPHPLPVVRPRHRQAFGWGPSAQVTAAGGQPRSVVRSARLLRHAHR